MTRDRPEALAAAVRSYARNCRSFGRDVRWLVVDDSASREARDRNCRVLADIRDEFRIPVLYAGFEEKRAFSEHLRERSGVARGPIAFALFDLLRTGQSFGANRNALLLGTAGEMILMADDDTLCRCVLPPERRPPTVFASGRPPIDYWFFPDLERGIASLEETRGDVLGLHATLLGRDLADIVAAAESVEFDRIDDSLLDMLAGGRGSVLATHPGLLGDAGGGNPIHHILNARGPSHRRLVASDEAYRSACTSRISLRAAAAPTVNHGEYCMATSLGLDARGLLPPFFPFARCEDNLFGVFLRRLAPDACMGHLPVALIHAPRDARLYREEAVVAGASQIDMAWFVAAQVVAEVPRPDRDFAARLAALGTRLEAIGTMRDSEFEEMARATVGRILKNRALDAERCLGFYRDAPEAWRRDVARHVTAVRERVDAADAFVPAEFYAPGGEVNLEDALRMTRRTMRAYGLVLSGWPEMVAGATALRAEGRPLARSL